MKYPEILDKMINSLFLKGAVKEMAEKLNANKNADAYETLCGALFLENNEDVQVKIIVTRKKEDFIGAFDVIEHNTLVGK